MAHPSRSAAAERTLEAIKGPVALEHLEVAVLYDPDPAGPPSPWRTFSRIVATAPRDGTLLVVQEDVIVGRGFAAAAQRIAEVAPECVVALYAGKLLRSVPHLRAAAARCATLADLNHGEYFPTVACLIPGHLLDDLDSWGRRNAPEGYRHDDELCGSWIRNKGLRALTTIPSLVDHDNHVPSIAGHSQHGARSAWCLSPVGFDLASLDWRLP